MTAPESLSALCLAMASAAGIAAWFAASAPRKILDAAPPAWLRGTGANLAAMLAVVQTGLSVELVGAVAGPFIVASAWMIAGSLLVPALNAWPKTAWRWSWRIGLAALLLALLGA